MPIYALRSTKMTFHIITIFPEIFDSYFNESIIKRALESNKIKIKIHNLRGYTEDKHKTVDDTPYGGGAGMVMKVDVLYKALCALRQQTADSRQQKIILLSAKGKTWSQPMAKKHTKYDDIILICGRYEGVDERILNFVDEEISIGDYVLTGGEIPAMAIVDSVTRLIPGVVGNEMSPIDESHSKLGVLEYPQYTRPEIFIDKNNKKYNVPNVLKNGNHAEIEKWKEKHKKRQK